MTLNEFQDAIDRADKKLGRRYEGVCSAIRNEISRNGLGKGYLAKNYFAKLLGPYWDSPGSLFWFSITKENLHVRRTFLRMFEAVMIESQEYLEF